jgi:hypothetical protein
MERPMIEVCECSACEGRGSEYDETCVTCGGRGYTHLDGSYVGDEELEGADYELQFID